jgi:hypothetical protein
MFNQQELQAMQALLNRVDLKGSEATMVAILLQKISDNLKPEEVKESKEPKEK